MQRNDNTVTYFLLFLILGIGAFLRFSHLSTIPPGLTLDEVSIGYNAFTIASTGKDQDGIAYPITHFRSLADYKLSLPIYLVAISQYFFGTPALAVRFPSALFGTLTILVTFLLTRTLFNRSIALLASALLAISPWHSFHSHLGLETNIALFFSTLALYLMIAARKHPRLYFPWAFATVAAIYSHHSFWLFLPAVTAVYFLSEGYHLKREHAKAYLFLSLMFIVVFLFPFMLENPLARQARFGQSLLGKDRIDALVKQSSTTCKKDDQWCTNRFVAVKTVERSIGQYVSSFSLLMWYMPTSFDLTNVMPNRGLFYFLEFPLLISGLVHVYTRKYRYRLLLTSWLFLFPLPLVVTSTITAARMYQLLPLPQILESVGLSVILGKFPKLLPITLLVMIFVTLRMVSDMWFAYPFTYSRYAEYGSTAIETYIKNNPSKQIYIEEPLYHPLRLYFLYNILPNDIPPRSENKSGRVAGSAKNVIITERGYLPPNKETSILISFKEDIPRYFRETGTIDLLDNAPYAIVSGVSSP